MFLSYAHTHCEYLLLFALLCACMCLCATGLQWLLELTQSYLIEGFSFVDEITPWRIFTKGKEKKKKHKNSSFLLYMPHYTEIGNSLLGKIIICRTNLWYMWTGKFRSQFNRCCLCFHKLTTPATYHYAYNNKSHTQCKGCVCLCACKTLTLLSHQGFTLVLSVKLPASTEVASAMP